MEISKEPWLVRPAIQFLDLWLSHKCKVLEFGCGGSTIWLGRRVGDLISIEHNAEWAAAVSEQKCANTVVRCLPRPYAKVCDLFTDSEFDLVLVDGRDRVACFLQSMMLLRSGGIIMLDNSERPNYVGALAAVADWDCCHAHNGDDGEWRTSWWTKP